MQYGCRPPCSSIVLIAGWWTALQDAHRQRTVNWCDSTGGTNAAFDFTTKGILQEALGRTELWRLVDAQVGDWGGGRQQEGGGVSRGVCLCGEGGFVGEGGGVVCECGMLQLW